ncbi:hypothetical protein RINTHH_2280 [Richelia intracellularis HH01]|uniref:Uncharacterized protein n=1 Tax=Richelia intracellularis HH01 TaxID=1165094 RepID=M1WZ05_9NOST|nr:hypothetical protein RINTHH_2280 [Richelia intracellularis HH01]
MGNTAPALIASLLTWLESTCAIAGEEDAVGRIALVQI